MKLNCRSLINIFSISALPLISTAVDTPPTAKKPNVLFVVFDDLSTRMGCYGDPIAKTPNLDRLAERGTVFERAYCQQPICGPSRASFMSGRRPNTLGIWSMTQYLYDCHPDIQIIPEWFKNNGYTSMSIGKVLASYSHTDKSDFFRLDKTDRRTGGKRKDEFWPDNPEGKPLPPNLAKDPLCENRDLPDESCFDTLSADLAISELRDLAGKPKPFFLALGFFKPHTPYKIPKRYWDLYNRADIPAIEHPYRPENAPDIAFHANHEVLGTGADHRSIDEEAKQEIRHGYYAATSFVDAQFGRVLEELDRLNIADNTIVVVFGDNGFHLGEQDTWGKMTLYELDARVPMIISAPMLGVPAAKTVSIAELIDLFPTLTDLCGLPAPNWLDGVSLAPVLKDPSAKVKDVAITQYPRPALYWGGGLSAEPETMGYVLHGEKFNYNRWCDFKTGKTVAEELYNQPGALIEAVNLVDKPEYALLLNERRKLFEQTVKHVSEPAPKIRPDNPNFKPPAPKPEPAAPPVKMDAGVYFQQEFPEGSTLQSIQSHRPTAVQFDRIMAGSGDTFDIVNGALQLRKGGAVASTINRTTALGAAPLTLFKFQFDIGFSFTNQTANKSLGFYELYNNGPTTVWGTFGFAVDSATSNTWKVTTGITGVGGFTGVQTVKVYVNDTGSNATYIDPLGVQRTITNTYTDIWVGNTLAKSSAATGLTNYINAFRYVSPANGITNGTLTFDNFLIEVISEPQIATRNTP